MHVTIVDNQHIYLSNITADEEDIVENHFQAERPGRSYIDLAHATWDGVYRKYHRGKKRLARPFLGELRALCRDKKLALSMSDERKKSKYKPIPIDKITPDLLPGITLEDYQINGIKKIYKTEVGVFESPTGSGKTEIIAGICSAMRCPTAIVAEQRQVVEQIHQRLKLRKVCEEPGMFYAGKMPTGEMILVGTVQSLIAPSKPPKQPIPSPAIPDRRVSEIAKAAIKKADFQFDREGRKYTAQGKEERKYYDKYKRWMASTKAYKSRKKKAKLLHELIKRCDMIIVDECDLATSNMYRKIFQYWYRGRRRYGFTGTAHDEDKPVERLILQEHLGSVVYKISRQKVEKADRIIPFEYYMIAFGENGNPKDATMYDLAINEFMVYNEAFHDAIANLCAAVQEHEDDGTLILVERDDLGHALKAKIPNSEFVHGKTSKKRRPEILRSFEERAVKVLIGGKNVRRGLDLDGGCENLIIATGGKLSSELNQKIGRAVRRNRRGKARVWDWYFLCNKYLYEHSRRRLKAVAKMRYPSFVVFTGGMVDGDKFIKSRFRKPRNLTEFIL